MHSQPSQQFHNKKNKLQKQIIKQNDHTFDREIIHKAVNNSHLKRMARSFSKQDDESLNNNNHFVNSFVPQAYLEKQLEEFWCIVALNEEILQKQKSFLSCSCSSHPNAAATSFDLSGLKLYQLFIGLGSKQLRFQSLQHPKGYFVVNMDTVETQILYSDVNDKLSQNHIKLVVQGKYNLDFFFTSSTLPFGVRQNASEEEAKTICSDFAKHTDLIIRKSIGESKGVRYGLRSRLLPDQHFYLHRYATQQQFAKYAQSGDIILFKDNYFMAKVQRFFTNSQCDHIGVIFKDQIYGLCIFQSNSNTGVSLAMWSQVIREKWFQNIEGIYWRRLNMQNKPQNFQKKIHEFIKANLRKQYGISIGKLLSFSEITYSNPDEEKNRTYFCSQLIAALYKYLGLLEPNKPSSTYLPKDFTDNGSLNMINNTALEAEKRLIFNQKLLKESYKYYKATH